MRGGSRTNDPVNDPGDPVGERLLLRPGPFLAGFRVNVEACLELLSVLIRLPG